MGTKMVNHDLVHSFQEVLGDFDLEDNWLEEHEDEVIMCRLDDPHFCSCSLVFIPSKDMGFSCYRTSNCVAGAYVGFFYPGHVATLSSAGDKLVNLLETWGHEGELR